MMEMVHTTWTTLSSSSILRWVVVFAILYFLANKVSFFRARKVQPGIFRWQQAITEVVLITISGAFGAFFLGAFSKWLTSHGWAHTAPGATHWWIVLIEFVVFFVLFDTWFYWWHRLMHVEPIYTLVHRWHHTSLTPTVVSTMNINPLEALINGGFPPLFVAVASLVGMPIHAASMPFIGASGGLIGFWIHSGFEFFPRWWTKSWTTKWFITTTFHDQHHQFFKYNYGGFSTVWDRICGTMRPTYDQDFANPRGRIVEAKRRQAKLAEKQGKTPATAGAIPTPTMAMDAPAGGNRDLVRATV
jgi:sterol desaturase/sphingolipid hydroxylase (fatty acid hydroxylase superfamily)